MIPAQSTEWILLTYFFLQGDNISKFVTMKSHENKYEGRAVMGVRLSLNTSSLPLDIN